MKWHYYKHEKLSLVTLYRVVYEGAVTFCSNLRDGVNCRMPQSVGNGGVTFRWEVMQTGLAAECIDAIYAKHALE